MKTEKKFILPECMHLDRQVSYKGIVYQIVEILNSEMLLVVIKDDFDNEVFPLQTYVIPGQ